MLIDAAKSCLLIIDVQDGLTPVMHDPRAVFRGCALLMRAALRLEIPLLITEQYPKGLGPTAGELRALAPAATILPKLHFSCAHDPAILEHLRALDRPQVVMAGIEAHVCVLQSALGLKAAGFAPVVVADACSSRAESSHRAALERLARNGVEVASLEMTLFEWLGQAGTPAFKDLLNLIK